MNLALLCLLAFLVLAQLVNWGLQLWRYFGPKLLLVNYTVTGGDPDVGGGWSMHCSNFGRVRGPITDAALDALLNRFIERMRQDYPDLNGYSLNGVLRLDAPAPLPKES